MGKYSWGKQLPLSPPKKREKGGFGSKQSSLQISYFSQIKKICWASSFAGKSGIFRRKFRRSLVASKREKQGYGRGTGEFREHFFGTGDKGFLLRYSSSSFARFHSRFSVTVQEKNLIFLKKAGIFLWRQNKFFLYLAIFGSHSIFPCIATNYTIYKREATMRKITWDKSLRPPQIVIAQISIFFSFFPREYSRCFMARQFYFRLLSHSFGPEKGGIRQSKKKKRKDIIGPLQLSAIPSSHPSTVEREGRRERLESWLLLFWPWG